jgi:hypothetical protein
VYIKKKTLLSITSLNLLIELADKIYEIKLNSDNDFLKIISYFSLSEIEKQFIKNLEDKLKSFNSFSSIFSDVISDQEWQKSKNDIKKHFQDEIFEID